MRRISEVLPKIEEWVAARTADEILETAAPFRIPVGAVMSGSSSTQLECYKDFFEEKATGFKPWKRVASSALCAIVPTARDGLHVLHDDLWTDWCVADFTAFWAGPYAGSLLASPRCASSAH